MIVRGVIISECLAVSSTTEAICKTTICNGSSGNRMSERNGLLGLNK